MLRFTLLPALVLCCLPLASCGGGGGDGNGQLLATMRPALFGYAVKGTGVTPVQVHTLAISHSDVEADAAVLGAFLTPGDRGGLDAVAADDSPELAALAAALVDGNLGEVIEVRLHRGPAEGSPTQARRHSEPSLLELAVEARGVDLAGYEIRSFQVVLETNQLGNGPAGSFSPEISVRILIFGTEAP